MSIHPFSKRDASDAFRSLVNGYVKEIRELDDEYVAKASQTELENAYIEKATIQPLDLRVAEWYIEKRRGELVRVPRSSRRGYEDVTATVLDIAIPFEGPPGLWNLRPSKFKLSGYPEIELMEDRIILTVNFQNDSPEADRIKSEINETVRLLAEAIENLLFDVQRHNESTPNAIREAIRRKRETALSALGTVAALGIPIKRRDPPPTFSVPLRRRKSPAKRPNVETDDFSPEPALEESDYEHILGVMRSMSLVMERSPSVFATLNEETIRNHFLIQLNGHYEGGATGETFNASGKTDILIREEDKTVFIAECKFWRGKKSFNKAVDQLLSYLTWRDARCALLVFNKRPDSADVGQKMHEVMQQRPEHRETLADDVEKDSRYVLVKESEPGREIIVTTQLYSIPKKEDK